MKRTTILFVTALLLMTVSLALYSVSFASSANDDNSAEDSDVAYYMNEAGRSYSSGNGYSDGNGYGNGYGTNDGNSNTYLYGDKTIRINPSECCMGTVSKQKVSYNVALDYDCIPTKITYTTKAANKGYCLCDDREMVEAIHIQY